MTQDEFYTWLAEQGIIDSLTGYEMWQQLMPQTGATRQDAELALERYYAQPSIRKTPS